MRFWNRLRLRAARGWKEGELNDEIRLHRELLEEEFQREGMRPEEARRAAARQFGNPGWAADVSRDEWSFPRLDAWAKDLRFALRLLFRYPLLTSAAVLTVAFGVGANTAILSILQTVLLNPLGIPHTDRVAAVRVHIDRLHFKNSTASAADLRGVQGMDDVFSAVSGSESRVWTFLAGGTAMRMTGLAVTPEFFPVFQTAPALGRFFHGDDRGSAVLAYKTWETQFGRDANIVGRDLMLDGAPFRIVGVAPANFRYPTDAMAYVPLVLDAKRVSQGRGMNMIITILARLRPGVSPQQASHRIRQLNASLAASNNEEGRNIAKLGYGIHADSFAVFLAGDLRDPLWMLWAAALVVLLTGCANVAGLLLTRSAGRRKEMAIRLSVGATRWQILRQLLLESTLLGLAGGIAGLAMARLAVALVSRVSMPSKDLLTLVALDNRMLLYGLGLAIVSSVFFGLAPAMQLLRDSQSSEMARSRRKWFQDMFVTAEVGGAFVLVVMTGLLLRSLWTVQQIHPGFDAHQVSTAYYTKPKNDPGFEDRLKDALQNAPGVQSAALVYPAPLTQGGLTSGFGIRNRQPLPGEPEWHGEAYFVTPEYFATLRIPIVAGRNLAATDTAGAPLVCVIDRNLADRFFPKQNPIGQEIAMYAGWARIVGVAAAVRTDSVEEDARPMAYYSLPQTPYFSQGAVVVRSQVSAAGIIRDTVRSTNASAPVYDVRTLEERLSEKLGIRRVLAVLLSIFGGVSLLLATIGIYGVVAQVVAERTQEIGIRMALGARPSQILRRFVLQGLRAAGIGLLLGAIATLSLQQWIGAMLYHVRPLDIGAIATALGATLLVAGLAVWWPARRAARIDAGSALRHE